jgi:hypothetical protein
MNGKHGTSQSCLYSVMHGFQSVTCKIDRISPGTRYPSTSAPSSDFLWSAIDSVAAWRSQKRLISTNGYPASYPPKRFCTSKPSAISLCNLFKCSRPCPPLEFILLKLLRLSNSFHQSMKYLSYSRFCSLS